MHFQNWLSCGRYHQCVFIIWEHWCESCKMLPCFKLLRWVAPSLYCQWVVLSAWQLKSWLGSWKFSLILISSKLWHCVVPESMSLKRTSEWKKKWMNKWTVKQIYTKEKKKTAVCKETNGRFSNSGSLHQPFKSKYRSRGLVFLHWVTSSPVING